MSLPALQFKPEAPARDPVATDGFVMSVLALAVIVPCFGGALDNRLQGIAAVLFEGGAILLTAVLLWGTRWRWRRKDAVEFLLAGINAPVLLWLLVVLGSWAFGPIVAGYRPYSTQEALRQAAGVAVFFAVTLRFRRTEQLVQLAQTLLLVGVIAAVAGCVQYGRHEGGLATGPFHDHQLCGSCLAVLLPMAAGMAFGAWETNRQLAAQAATALIAIGLLVTYTRSSWIGAAAGMIVMVGIAALTALAGPADPRVQGDNHSDNQGDNQGAARGLGERRRRSHYAPAPAPTRKPDIAFPLMVCLVVVGFVALLANRGGVNDRLVTFGRLALDQSWQRRIQAWKGAAGMIGERPLFGCGIGQYAVLQRGYTHLSVPINRIGGRPSLAEQAHNIYLHTAAEVGVIGMIVFAAIPLAFILQGMARLRAMQSGPRKYLLSGAVGAIAAFAIDACGNPAWQCGQVSILLWLILGLGACCLRSQRRGRADAAVEVRPQASPLRYACVGVCLLLLLLPTAALSVSGTFPDHVEMEPRQIDAAAPHRVELRLFLVNTDGSRRDVTNVVGTKFEFVGSGGNLRKAAGRIYYEHTVGTTYDGVITGIFAGATPDIVAPMDRDMCAIKRRQSGASQGTSQRSSSGLSGGL